MNDEPPHPPGRPPLERARPHRLCVVLIRGLRRAPSRAPACRLPVEQAQQLAQAREEAEVLRATTAAIAMTNAARATAARTQPHSPPVNAASTKRKRPAEAPDGEAATAAAPKPGTAPRAFGQEENGKKNNRDI